MPGQPKRAGEDRPQPGTWGRLGTIVFGTGAGRFYARLLCALLALAFLLRIG